MRFYVVDGTGLTHSLFKINITASSVLHNLRQKVVAQRIVAHCSKRFITTDKLVIGILSENLNLLLI